MELTVTRDGENWIFQDEDGEEIGLLYDSHGTETTAFRMAASSDLLEALEDFLSAYGPPDDGPLSWEALNDAAVKARTAIAKARGE